MNHDKRIYGEGLTSIDELKVARTKEIVDREFSLADTIDIKTGILLAVVVFLATQTGGLLGESLLLWVRVTQYLSVGSQVFAGICSIVVLWPRDYRAERRIDEYDGWIDTVTRNHSADDNPVAGALRSILSKRYMKTRERAVRYTHLNDQKSLFLGLAFYGTAAALVLNLAALASRLF